MRKTRIGNFGKNLGVTSDFLKHHESYGLITPEEAENGYRYYDFSQSARVIQIMKLRNMGVKSKQIAELMFDSSEEAVMDTFAKQEEYIEKHIEFEKMILTYMEGIKKIRSEVEQGVTWKIIVCEPFKYILNGYNGGFMELDESDYEVIRSWNEFMPLVESFTIFDKDTLDKLGRGELCNQYMGLSVASSVAKKFHLATNEHVMDLPKQKCLVYNYSGNITPRYHEKKTFQQWILEEPLRIVEEHGFVMKDHPCSIIHYQSNTKVDNYTLYSVFIPIE